MTDTTTRLARWDSGNEVVAGTVVMGGTRVFAIIRARASVELIRERQQTYIEDWFRDRTKIRAWAELNSDLLEDFDRDLNEIADLPHRDMTAMLLAALKAARENRPFYVRDALGSMNAKGTDQPSRSIDDPRYATKYKRLQYAIAKGFLEYGPKPKHDERLRPVVPTKKLNDVFSRHCEEGYSRLQALLIDFEGDVAYIVIAEFYSEGEFAHEYGCFDVSSELRGRFMVHTRDATISAEVTFASTIRISFVSISFTATAIQTVSGRCM
ncbi:MULTISPECIES: hypothetical protein [unclassified Bradyrhizobium]|uniref:hypothetical protein n=1 Tax=unclassified Bradyrhizobium TaxID=2631580 RepID=UPI0028ED3B38|nr:MULTISPECIES: hypothetical protein [unclassified Bradyrhizobium]